MSFVKGDLLTKTRKLVKGMAMAKPVWLKAMEEAPPVNFPSADAKVKKLHFPEDKYVKKFFQKRPNLKHDDSMISSFDPPPARVFGWRVLELKEQGVNEEDAIAVADMEFRAERTAKREAYAQLKQMARRQGKEPPPNPFPKVNMAAGAEGGRFVGSRLKNPQIMELVKKMKAR